MYGEKSFELLKDLSRTLDNVPPYNDDCFKKVLDELRILYRDNEKDMSGLGNVVDTQGTIPNIALRHAAIGRNERCCLTYLYNRLQRVRKIRWELGSILPAEVKVNLSNNELEWAKNYSKLLASYMSTIGDGIGLDITQDVKPPGSFCIEVKSNENYGRFELDCGGVIILKKNHVYHLQRSQCENLVRQGILEHIT